MDSPKLSRNELKQKLHNKMNQLRLNNNRPSKKHIQNAMDLVKNETKNPKISPQTITYYQSLVDESNKSKNKNILKPSELLTNDNITTEMLDLYYLARLSYKDIKVPLPGDILNDKVKYKQVYNEFLINLMNMIKNLDTNQQVTEIQKLMKNPYSQYMTKCLDIPLNPFTNKNIDKKTNTNNIDNKVKINDLEENISQDYEVINN
jgi:hypothetical protein